MNLIDRAVAMTLPIVPKPIVRFFSKRCNRAVLNQSCAISGATFLARG